MQHIGSSGMASAPNFSSGTVRYGVGTVRIDPEIVNQPQP